ncbi:hypothetical protein O181_130448, partial [Austropuccinia psidii MF-1]|nr:hypothetical protein [Austropuccinia psidii MF-1]
MSSWHILKRFLTEEEIVRYSDRWNPLSSKPQIKNIKEYHAKKKEAKKEEATVDSTRNPQASPIPQEGKKKKKELEKIIFPKLQDSKNPKRCHGQCLQHGQSLDGIQGQGGSKNETTSFCKEITLSPDVVNTLTEIKNSLLSLQEINNNLSSLTKIAVQNKNKIDNIKLIVENNKPKVLIDNTQKFIQGEQELYKYIKDINDKTLTINHD